MSTLRNLKNKNIDNAKIAAKIEGGKVINHNLSRIVQQVAPANLAEYAQHPLGKLVVANVLEAVVSNVPALASNTKVRLVSDAALLSATTEAAASFQLAKLINDNIDSLFKGVKVE